MCYSKSVVNGVTDENREYLQEEEAESYTNEDFDPEGEYLVSSNAMTIVKEECIEEEEEEEEEDEDEYFYTVNVAKDDETDEEDEQESAEKEEKPKKNE